MLSSRRRAIITGAAIVAGGTVAAAALLRKPAPEIHTPLVGPDEARVVLQPATALTPTEPPRTLPRVTFTDADGHAHDLTDYAGQGVVLNFWATWCVPCVAEMPALARMAKVLADDRIVLLALSADRGGAATVRRYFQEHDIDGVAVLLDPHGAAAEAIGARGLPTTLIVDRSGHERARLEGAADWTAANMLQAVRRLVG